MEDQSCYIVKVLGVCVIRLNLTGPPWWRKLWHNIIRLNMTGPPWWRKLWHNIIRLNMTGPPWWRKLRHNIIWLNMTGPPWWRKLWHNIIITILVNSILIVLPSYCVFAYRWSTLSGTTCSCNQAHVLRRTCTIRWLAQLLTSTAS